MPDPSKHGVRRVRKRRKLTTKAAKRHIELVRKHGTPEEKMSRVLREVVAGKKAAYPTREFILYEGFFYIFEADNGVLITAFECTVPEHYH